MYSHREWAAGWQSIGISCTQSGRLFYQCFLLLLLSLLAKTDAYAQCNNPVQMPLSADADGVIFVNQNILNTFLQQMGCVPDANTTIELLIPAAVAPYTAARFEDLNIYGADDNPQIVIKLSSDTPGEARFSGYTYTNGSFDETDDSTIEILNCHRLELDGHGIKVLDAYGNGIPDGPNQQGVNIAKASSHIKVHHLDVQNPSGFAGIMAKDSPECVGGSPVDQAEANVPFMHHIYIHDNYIHNISQGEGIYAGDTAFMTGRIRGSCGRLFPQRIEDVHIFNNFIEKVGLDAIQLGSCIKGGIIQDNFCVDYGTLGKSSQANGIQIGLGNIGTVCERNFVRQSAELAENFGNGILCQGVANNCIKNNILYNTMENSVFVNEITVYDPSDVASYEFITEILQNANPDDYKGVSILHNTLMYPEKSDDSAFTRFGIHVIATFPGHVIKNNLIFGLFGSEGSTNPGTIGSTDNKTITEGWKTVKENYLRSYGSFDVPNDVPYAAAMQAYFTQPAISEEDNYFRSPTDFYPIHPDIVDSATGELTGTCDAGADYMGIPRTCASDFGAVELDYPIFSITENCETGKFTILADYDAETFSWTFDGMTRSGPNPEFDHPNPGEAGVYQLFFTNTNTNNCIKASGTIEIELTCSCACTGPNAINIDAEEGTSWQDTEIMDHVTFYSFYGNVLDLTNHCLNIKGRLLIDDFDSFFGGLTIDLLISGGSIWMQPGAEIVVQDQGGLSIANVNAQDGTYGKGIHGCDFMWKGIDVEEGGRIEVENSTIQDAVTAIGITGSAEISIQNNRFENNYRGLDIGPVIDLTNNDPIPFSLTLGPNWLSGNYFGTLAGGLKGTVDGGIPDGEDSKGNVGIKMAYLKYAHIQGDEPNVFAKLRHGIYARESYFAVSNNSFSELDYGARLFGGASHIENNTFDDIKKRGIEFQHPENLFAYNNTMTNVHGRGINCEGGGGIYPYHLWNNTIASMDHAINVEQFHAVNGLYIKENNLTLLSPDANTPPFLNRSAIRVFSTSWQAGSGLSLSKGEISNHAAININGYGKGIALENVNEMELNYNNTFHLNDGMPMTENAEYRGINLENSAKNRLYGNSVEGSGSNAGFRGFHLASSANNTLCCNNTDGGGTGLYFSGPCNMDQKLNNTTIGSHTYGLQCEDGAKIGEQEHTGNQWGDSDSYGEVAAAHFGSDDDITESLFTVADDFVPPSIFPDPLEITWFREINGDTPGCTDEENTVCSPQPNLPGGKESDEKVAKDTYATGEYAIVHNWEAGLDLFTRLNKNESLRNSEVWYQNFYAQVDAAAIGDYVRVREQFKTLLSLSDEERQSTELLWTDIQDNLKTLTEIGEAYSQATTEADSILLEASWREQYIKVSDYFADWKNLSKFINQRIASSIPALQAANAALPEEIVPAANEKFMNTIDLQRILGVALTEKQGVDVTALAFSCPLEAGNAVYRARTLLRKMGDYVFDDASICGLEEHKEESNTKRKRTDLQNDESSVEEKWRIYPNPTREQVWLEGPQGVSLAQVQLYDHLGRMLSEQGGGVSNKQELKLPPGLSAGIYFLVLEQADGSCQTRRLIIKP